MRPRWANLNELDRAAFRATIAFLNGRLEERATVDWALRLKPNDTIKRLALLDLIDSPEGRKISEPWRSAWRLIEESWNNPAVEDHASTGAYDVQHRLRAGDRSGSLVTAIVELVAPRLKVEAVFRHASPFPKTTKTAKKGRGPFLDWADKRENRRSWRAGARSHDRPVLPRVPGPCPGCRCY